MQRTYGITLRLFGSAELSGVPAAMAYRILAQPRLVALLAYLSVPSGGRFLRRDEIVGCLWPELPQESARRALRKAMHTLRQSLGDGALASRGVEEIALSDEVVWCDVAAFTAAAESGMLMQALQLYRHELLPGFHLPDAWEFDQWLERQRADARERASAAAWALAQRFESETQLSDAGRWARVAVRYSGVDERALRRALQMLDRLGDRAGALRLYEDFARRLSGDLDIEPSPETQQLVMRLRQRDGTPAS